MSLWHEATSLDRIIAATRRAARGKSHRPAVARFLMDAEPECLRLQHALRAPVDHPAAWWPDPVEILEIRDPKPRLITVTPFRDRVVHHVLCAALEPSLERFSIHHSYACRRGKGQHRALRQCQRFARSSVWALKADVASFFASIPHGVLLARLQRLVEDDELYQRVARALAGPCPGIPPATGRGLPIGALTSQHLASFYLGLLDHWITDGLGLGRYLRYMDDFVIFGSRQQLCELLPRLRAFLIDRMGLCLNERHSGIVRTRDGISFLGFRVFPAQIRASAERWRRFRRRQQHLELLFERGQLDEQDLGRSMTSMYAHLQAFDTFELRRRHLRMIAERRGRGRTGHQPGYPRRLVEERPAQRARRESQQGRALGPQRQPRLSRGELNATAAGSRADPAAGPVEVTSRSGVLRPGIEQTPVPCLGPAGAACAAPLPEAESKRPGGGASGVAAGPLLRGRS